MKYNLQELIEFIDNVELDYSNHANSRELHPLQQISFSIYFRDKLYLVSFLSTNIQNDHGDSIIHYLLRKCDLFHWHITICILGVWLVYVHGDESEIQASAWCRWSDEQSPTFPWSHHFSDQPIPGQGCHPYRGYVCTYAKVLRDFNENQHLLLQWICQREILIQLRRSKDLYKTSQLKKKLLYCESVKWPPPVRGSEDVSRA